MMRRPFDAMRDGQAREDERLNFEKVTILSYGLYGEQDVHRVDDCYEG